MTLDSVYEIIMAFLPAATSVFSCIGVAIGILSKFQKLREEVKDKTDLEEYKAQLEEISIADKETISELVQQNYQLQSQIAELVDKIDKIKRNK